MRKHFISKNRISDLRGVDEVHFKEAGSQRNGLTATVVQFIKASRSHAAAGPVVGLRFFFEIALCYE